MIGVENCRIGSVLKIGPQVVEQQERLGNWETIPCRFGD